MLRRTFLLGAVLLAILASDGSAFAQAASDLPPSAGIQALRKWEDVKRVELNEWTVGIGAGPVEEAPLRLAAEIAQVVDDGPNLQALPVVTRGSAGNILALLYQRGVDLAIVHLDSIDEVKSELPWLPRRIRYLTSLFPSEVHILARPEIKKIQDLDGAKVNFGAPGTASAHTGPLILSRLGITVTGSNLPYQVAIEKLRSGDLAAVVLLTAKPADALLKRRWDAGFKLLDVPYDGRLADDYLPAAIKAADYPELITPGREVHTLAVPMIIAAYNWEAGSDRYRRIERLTQALFGKIDQLQVAGFHPKWRDVNLAATVPGLERLPAAEEWLRKRTGSGLSAEAAVAAPAVQARRPTSRYLQQRAEQRRAYRAPVETRSTRSMYDDPVFRMENP
jgi:TRAP-type uncharacterized transport system substrate-binding protein